MKNILEEVLDTREVENESWKIKNDEGADWWIEAKETELAEVRRLKMQLENKITFYKERLEKVQKEEEFIIERRNGKLAEYFESINEKDMKVTKTQKKYRLPSGELVKKFPGPQYKKDDEKLSKWLETNQMSEYIEVKKQAKWGDLKKATKVVNGQVVIKDTGEMVEGVEVIERAPNFKVEVK